ncbi:MAG: O-antigen ligase family protein [Planctomycetota bacterium]
MDRETLVLQMEIPLPLVAAAASTAAAIPAVLAWWLTESIGAIASGLVAGLAAVVLYVWRRPARAHRRGLVAAASIAFVVATAGVIAFGVARDGLPMRTLQVRWEYWTGSMAVLGERPLLGAGPGNFPDAYLPHRPLGAEEAVKNPHNVIAHVLAEYGLVGGGLYLALLAWALVALTRRGRGDESWRASGPRGRRWWILIAAVGAGAMAWRIGWTRYPNALVLFVDNLVPLAALTAGLVVAAATGRADDDESRIDPAVPLAVACGVGGFALHNLSDFALFKPAAGMVFWVAAGALIAGTDRKAPTLPRPVVAALAAGLLAATSATAACILLPVRRSERHVLAAATAFADDNVPEAIRAMRRAVAADPADPNPAGDLANLCLAQARQSRDPQRPIARAAAAAAEAARRHPASVIFARQALETAVYVYRPDLLTLAWADPPFDPAEQLEALLEANPPGPRTGPRRLNVLAQLAFYAERYDHAERWLTQALDRADERQPILLDHLGDVRFAQGKVDQAVDAWRRYRRAVTVTDDEGRPAAERLTAVARGNPRDPYLRLRLAELAWHLGYDALARRELQAAVDVQDALWSGSPLRFNDRRRREVDRLRAKLNAVTVRPSP